MAVAKSNKRFMPCKQRIITKMLRIMSKYRDKFEYPENPASTEEIQALEKWLGTDLPSEYKKFLLETNGAETPIGVQEPDDSVVLWSAKEISELTEAYCYEQYLPGLVAIGSDGGGESIVFDTTHNISSEDWPVYRVPFGDLTKESMVLLAANFNEWVSSGYSLKF
ncbi:SMI1/KNR4 family protein [Shewanella putrefaciens]|uniref:SMI1/KNR4 family protein n=1 Tax=Shewanella putrefaciens TaxID=24 RepID=UPI001E49DE28|nr:SMI1/KNR4 family protein [Shewanella putrefaciens]MCT8945198.1 SMI1/KNR4 family protein [Shewanella putrefaciens]